jgi:hypothetical protein
MASESNEHDQTNTSPDAAENQHSQESAAIDQTDQLQRDRRARPSEDRRRKRVPGQERRVPAGYGDGIERAICMEFRHLGPSEFPIQHRIGLPTSRPIEVARRTDSVLLCDRYHDGDCVWPDGSFAFVDEPDEQPSPELLLNDTETSNVESQAVSSVESGGPPPTKTTETDSSEQTTGEETASGSSEEDWNGPGISDEDG